MKFEIACSSCFRDRDEPVLEILEKAETMPTVAELMTLTGLPEFRVRSTLRRLCQQISMAKSRKRITD